MTGIRGLFHIPDELSDGQRRWLKMCAAIPGAKQAFGDPVSEEDRALAQEATQILNDHPETKNHGYQSA